MGKNMGILCSFIGHGIYMWRFHSFHITYLIISWDSYHTDLFKSRHQRCSIKKVFLEILQNSLENTCARVSFLIKLQAFFVLFLQNTSGRLLLSFVNMYLVQENNNSQL